MQQYLKPSMEGGIFITFEGGEGCGKSSHIKALKEWFESRGFSCVITREPGGTPLAEKIRALLLERGSDEPMCALTELLLFEAARAQHVEALIRPALKAGKVVISDRFYDSTTAYQGAARALDPKTVALLNMVATSSLSPDLTIILDLPVAEGLARANLRDEGAADRMGSQSTDFYEAVRKAFLDLAKAEPERFRVVSSAGSKEETFNEILGVVRGKFGI